MRAARRSLLGLGLGLAVVLLAPAAPVAEGATTTPPYVWLKQFGTRTHDQARGVAVNSSAVYVVGRVYGALPGLTGAGGWDAFVRRYDHNGAVVWTRQFGTAAFDGANGVALDSSGNVYVAGDTEGNLAATKNGHSDAFLRKYTAAGAVSWTRQVSGTATSSFNPVEGFAGVTVAGSKVHAVGTINGRAALRTWTTAGAGSTPNATFALVTGKWAEAYDVVVNSAGAIFMAGDTATAGVPRAFVRRYVGTTPTTSFYGPAGGAQAYSIAAGSFGVLVAGTRWEPDYGSPWVRRYSTTFTTAWTYAPSTPSVQDWGWAVAATSTGTGYLGGWTGTDAFLRKLSPSGLVQWNKVFATKGYEEVHDVAVAPSGAVFAVGFTNGKFPGAATTPTGEDAFLARFAP